MFSASAVKWSVVGLDSGLVSGIGTRHGLGMGSPVKSVTTGRRTGRHWE